MNPGEIDPARRRALALLGLGAAALGGCCVTSSFDRNRIGRRMASSRLASPLSGAPAAALAGRTSAIDIHAHFFNATDAGVGGYLVHSIGHSAKPAMHEFLKKIEKALQAVVYLPASASQEYHDLLDREPRWRALSADAVDVQLDRAIEQRRTDAAAALSRAMGKEDVPGAYHAAWAEARPGVRAPDLRLDDPEVVRRLMDPFGTMVAPSFAGLSIAGVLRFVGCMLNDRWMNLRIFQKGYASKGVVAAFGALVDFDHWFDCGSRSSLRDQMRLHALLSRMSDGYMLPLIAYNPWTDVVEKGQALKLVKEAVEHYGYVGVKIYPPMGFRPGASESTCDTGATKPDDDLDYPDQTVIATHMKDLFAWAAKERIPVMAHANRSHGRNDDEDDMSAPCGWELLLAELGATTAPVINLAHFGGSAESGQWTVEFARLMAKHPGVYGDIGYWTAFRNCGGQADTCAAAERLLAARQAFQQVDQRVMYGSDWCMYVKEQGWQDYPDQVASSLPAGFAADDVLRRNALACFGLAPGGAHHQRVTDHLGKTPSWMA